MNTPLSQFHRNRSCELCDLSSGEVTNVCIPCHLFFEKRTEGRADQCVLIVGEAPGHNEDQQDRNFVGKSGQLLDSTYVHGPSLFNFADIYVTNAVRCRPPQNADPTKPQLRACQTYLKSDLNKLSEAYRRVAVLCVGSAASRTVVDKGVNDYAPYQSKKYDGSKNIWVFACYHPAYLLRNPAEERKVINVLIGLREWLNCGAIRKETMPDYTLNHPPPKETIQ